MKRFALVCIFVVFACAVWAADKTRHLVCDGDKVLANVRVLSRTGTRAKLLHDSGIGVFDERQFRPEDWRWVQTCDLQSLESSLHAGQSGPAQAGAPSLGIGGRGLARVGEIMSMMSVRVLWYYLVGFAVSVLVRVLLTDRLAARYAPVAFGAGAPRLRQGRLLLSLVEQVLYTGCIVWLHGAFVFVWLGVKTICRHGSAEVDTSDTAPAREAATVRFLLENALAVGAASTGGLMIRWLMNGHYHAWLLPVAVLTGVGILFAISSRQPGGAGLARALEQQP